MEQAQFDRTFQETMTPIAMELAAKDERLKDMLNRSFGDSQRADEFRRASNLVLREYGLSYQEATDHVFTLMHFEECDPYWGPLILKAADDPYISKLIEWICVSGLLLSEAPHLKKMVKDYHNDMSGHLEQVYDLPRELHDAVFNECENRLREAEHEVSHGQA